MGEMISICGLACHECGAYLATRSDDDEKRREVAELWSREYGADIKPEDINCDGCASGSEVVFSHCKVCEIRACGKERGVANCAFCEDYACQKLEAFFAIAPEAKRGLDAIRAGH